MLFDTHCHPNLAKIKDKNQIIKSFFEENKQAFLNFIGTDKDTNKEVLKLANSFENCFCSQAIHPCNVYDLDIKETMAEIEEIIKNDKNKKIVAIGECGLDYYWLKPENDEQIAKYKPEMQQKVIKLKKDLQKIFFKAHIELAKKYNLPIIIHNREAKDDVLEILKQTNFKNFIFHCYSENLDYAKKLLEFSPDAMISFSGIVTFKNALDIQKTAQNIPLKNILIETDSPYLTPTPFRGKEENEPVYTKYVLKKIIELRDEAPKEIKKQIFENSLKVFGIKK